MLKQAWYEQNGGYGESTRKISKLKTTATEDYATFNANK